MGELLNRENENCERLRDALDALPVEGNPQRSVEEWRAELPEAAAQHAQACEACRSALEEFAETRQALAAMATPVPGPWFVTRVMNAIALREREEEARDGVWISVRRLAPRLVALSAFLLLLGGSWRLQQRSREVNGVDLRSGDMVFDSSVLPTWYDDGLNTMNEVRP